MTNLAFQFAGNVRQEVMNPWRIAYDTGFGVLGTVLIDATGFDNVLGNVADAVDLSPQRTNHSDSAPRYVGGVPPACHRACNRQCENLGLNLQ